MAGSGTFQKLKSLYVSSVLPRRVRAAAEEGVVAGALALVVGACVWIDRRGLLRALGAAAASVEKGALLLSPLPAIAAVTVRTAVVASVRAAAVWSLFAVLLLADNRLTSN